VSADDTERVLLVGGPAHGQGGMMPAGANESFFRIPLWPNPWLPCPPELADDPPYAYFRYERTAEKTPLGRTVFRFTKAAKTPTGTPPGE
jgi:hypothetical protein